MCSSDGVSSRISLAVTKATKTMKQNGHFISRTCCVCRKRRYSFSICKSDFWKLKVHVSKYQAAWYGRAMLEYIHKFRHRTSSSHHDTCALPAWYQATAWHWERYRAPDGKVFSFSRLTSIFGCAYHASVSSRIMLVAQY